MHLESGSKEAYFYWEKDQWECFHIFLDSIIIRKMISDDIMWTWSSNGYFLASSFRRRLEDLSSNVSTVSKLIWQGVCPPKVEIFAWQLLRGRVLVKEVLSHFGCNPSSSLMCQLCKGANETIDHVFLHCSW